MNGWLLAYIIGVILFFILAIITPLYDEYRTNQSISKLDLNQYAVFLCECFLIGWLLSFVGAFLLLLHIFGIITIQRR